MIRERVMNGNSVHDRNALIDMSREIAVMPLCECHEGRIMICENHGRNAGASPTYIPLYTC